MAAVAKALETKDFSIINDALAQLQKEKLQNDEVRLRNYNAINAKPHAKNSWKRA